MENFKDASFTLPDETKDSLGSIKARLKDLLVQSIKKSAPKQRFGILFSGGIDSVLIAFICKRLGLDFVCYTSALSSSGLTEAQDIIWAEKAAKELDLKLKINKIRIDETERYIKKIIRTINDSNVIKVGVALPLYLSMEQAKKDGIKIMFSGLGSEELFAGYERHLRSEDINKECVNGLNNIYERDLTRDIAISKANGIDLKLPFLDEDLIDYSLKIPSRYKINGGIKKYILRLAAQDIGVPKDLAFRPKKAAQYGSKFDRAIEMLAKRSGFSRKSDYLDQFNPNPKLAALVSGGKDSLYALYLMKRQGFPVKCVITLKSQNPDSYMFHTPNIHIVNLQAEAMQLPLIEQSTEGKKEKELEDLKKAIKKAKEEYDIQGITTGALFSQYQKERVEKVCRQLKLKCYSPLWHMDQEALMRELLKNNFKVIMTAVAAEGLDKSWLGKRIDDAMIDKLVSINKKIGINVAGEGGEYESLVLNCPLFHKKIKILGSEIIEEDKNTAKLNIKKAGLVNK